MPKIRGDVLGKATGLSAIRTSGQVAALIVATLGGCDAPTEENLSTKSSELTASFQSGVNSYTGTVDGHITSQGGGNGGKDFTGTSMLMVNNTTSSYESVGMLRFDGLSLPTGAQVSSATLQLRFEDFSGGNILRAYYLKKAFNESAVGWTHRDTGITWSSPGAKGSGTDRSTTAAFSDTSWTGTGQVTKTYALDPATVQGWVEKGVVAILITRHVRPRLAVWPTRSRSHVAIGC